MNWQENRSISAMAFTAYLQELGMTPAAASRFLNQSQRQTYRMAHGQTPVPTPIALLLSSMLAHGDEPIVPKRVPGTY